jgi:hypothetical protein
MTAGQVERWRRLRRRQWGVAPLGSLSRPAPPLAFANQAIGRRWPLLAWALWRRKLRATGQRRIGPVGKIHIMNFWGNVKKSDPAKCFTLLLKNTQALLPDLGNIYFNDSTGL